MVFSHHLLIINTCTFIVSAGVMFYCISPTQRHQKCMELALEYNSDVNNKSKEGVAVFLQACETAKDNEKACLMMLEKGAEPNSKNDVSIFCICIYLNSVYM